MRLLVLVLMAVGIFISHNSEAREAKVRAVIKTTRVHDRLQCKALEFQAVELMQRLNELFGMKVGLNFITESPLSKLTKRPIRMMDANAGQQDEAGNEIVQMPVPCELDEDLPSLEFWAFIIAHEFSHKIIDKNYIECESYNEELRSEQMPNVESDVVTLYNINHINIYLMALKILNHWKMDTVKAVEDYGQYAVVVKNINDEESLQSMRATTVYLLQHTQTDFNTGNDFFNGEYFDGIEVLAPMLKKHYPKSTLVTEMRSRVYRQVKSCLILKADLRDKTFKLWSDLMSASK